MEVRTIVDRECPAISESASIRELVDRFRQTERTVLPVTNPAGGVVGVVSLHNLVDFFLPAYFNMLPSLDFLSETKVLEKNFLQQILDPVTSRLFLVNDIMIRPPITVGESEPAFKAMLMMEKNGIHHMPVIDEKGVYRGMLDQRKIILAYLFPENSSP